MADNLWMDDRFSEYDITEDLGVMANKTTEDDSRMTNLLAAAGTGDLDEIESLALAVPEVLENALFSEKPGVKTPMEAAAEGDHVDVVKRLMELGTGINPEKVVAGFHEAVICAARNGRIQMLRVLVETNLFSELDCENRSLRGLVDAAFKGDFGFISEQIDNKKKKGKVISCFGNSLATLFVIRGCPASCLRSLALRGVCLSSHDCKGYIPLMWAVLSENTECVSYLARRAIQDVDAHPIGDEWCKLDFPEKGRTPLMQAVYLRSVSCLKIMLDMITRHKMDALKAKTLVFALHVGNTEAVNLLMESGAKIDSFPGLDRIPIIDYISRLGNVECLNLVLSSVSNDRILHCLLDSRLNVNLFGSNVLDVLLDHLQYVSIPNRNKETLLMLATKHGYLEYARKLLDKIRSGKANRVSYLLYPKCLTSQEDVDQSLLYAIQFGHLSMFNLLLQYGADANTSTGADNALILACGNNSTSMAMRLIQYGAQINAKGFDAKTALLHSCLWGNHDLVELLLQHGADIEAQDSKGMTALMYLAEGGHGRGIEMLMKYKKDNVFVDQTDTYGRTALMIACRQGHDAVVKLLVTKYSAYISGVDKSGMTALMHACNYSQEFYTEFRVYGLITDVDTRRAESPMNYVKCVELLLSVNADTDVTGRNEHQDTVFSLALNRNERLIQILLDSGKMTSNGKLKPVHREAAKRASASGGICLEALTAVLNYKVFDWDWCPVRLFPGIAPLVVDQGLCPGKLTRGDARMYPLSFAFLSNQWDLVMLFLERLYFFQEDYTFLCTQQHKLEVIEGIGESGPSDLKDTVDEFTRQPLSLKIRAFLVASKAISLAGPPTLRRQRVDTLPIPEKLKRMLKFEKASHNVTL